MAIGGEVRRIRDAVLVVGHPQVIIVNCRARDRDERHTPTEHASVDGQPFGSSGAVVVVNVFDLTDLVAAAVIDVGTDPGFVSVGHRSSPRCTPRRCGAVPYPERAAHNRTHSRTVVSRSVSDPTPPKLWSAVGFINPDEPIAARPP